MPKEITIIQLLLDIYVHCQWELFSRGNGENKNVCEEFELDEREHISSVQSLSRVWLFATPWIAALQASLSITNSQSLLKLMPIESVMPSSHLIVCHPLLLLPPIPPSIRVFSNESTLLFYQISSYFIQHPMGQTPFKSWGYLVKDSSHCLLGTLWPTTVGETETRTEQLKPVVVCFSAVLSSSQDSWFAHL